MPKRKQLDSDQMITNKKLCESSENGSQDDGDPDSDVIVKTEVDIEFDESVDNDPLCEPNESNELNLAALSDNFLKEILGLVRNIEQRQKIMEKQQKYMQKQIVSRLDRLNLDVIAVRNEVLSLRGKPIEEQPWNPSIIPNTPFSEAEDFEAFEKIIEDKEAFNQTVSNFEDLTEKEFEKYIRLCWRKILVDKLAEKYSWRGTNIKKSIRVSLVTLAIRSAFKRKFPSIEDSDFDKTSQKFFQYAHDRISKNCKASGAAKKIKSEDPLNLFLDQS